jgi:hypothetical protein
VPDNKADAVPCERLLFLQMRQWEFMAHRGDDFNGCLPVFDGRIDRLSGGEGRILTIIILDFFRCTRFAVVGMSIERLPVSLLTFDQRFYS